MNNPSIADVFTTRHKLTNIKMKFDDDASTIFFFGQSQTDL